MSAILPPHAHVLAELADAEQGEGWMARCDEAGRYVALSAPFVAALAGVLRALGRGPVLEVCAGDGSLAAALRRHAVEVIAADAHPSRHAVAPVEPLAAHEALRRYQPRVVLGSFVPVDAGVDGQVLDDPGVQEYVVLGARLAGECGAACLWSRAGWVRTPLHEVTAWMVCRHDAWLGEGVAPLRHGEAWHLSRADAGGRERASGEQRSGTQ